MIKPRIVLCAVGPWADNKVLAPSLHIDGDVLFVDDVPHDCEFQPKRDARMRHAFAVSDSRVMPSLGKQELVRIAAHRSVLYVLSQPLDVEDAAQTAHHMMKLGARLLDAGAMALKCDSSGIAHSADRWRELLAGADAGLAAVSTERASAEERLTARVRFWSALAQTWVRSPLVDDGFLYTCGMHLLGRPDITVDRSFIEDDQDGYDLMDAFNNYQLAECEPGDLQDGQTFRRNEHEPRFALQSLACDRYEEDDFFFNPYGYWSLQPVTQARQKT